MKRSHLQSLNSVNLKPTHFKNCFSQRFSLQALYKDWSTYCLGAGCLVRVLLDGGSVVPGGNINVLGNKTHLSTAAAVPTPAAAAELETAWRQDKATTSLRAAACHQQIHQPNSEGMAVLDKNRIHSIVLMAYCLQKTGHNSDDYLCHGEFNTITTTCYSL